MLKEMSVVEQNVAFFDIEESLVVTLSADGVDGAARLHCWPQSKRALILCCRHRIEAADVSALSPTALTIGEADLLLAGCVDFYAGRGYVDSIRARRDYCSRCTGC